MNPEDHQENQSGQQTSNAPTKSEFPDTLPPSIESDRLGVPSRDGTLLSQLYSQPLVTTLSGFSQVANLVRNPYELINNVDEFVKQAASRKKHGHRCPITGDNIAQTLNQNRSLSTPTSPVVQEMDTFVTSSHDKTASCSTHLDDGSDLRPIPENQMPIPALPQIESNSKRGRMEPLTIEEYETNFRKAATDLELINRVFYGGMSCNQLRAALWPYLFGIVSQRGRFEKIYNHSGKEAFLLIENEQNILRWTEMQNLYDDYQSQWMSIMPDQELRFSTFRERKSLIERDVIRCDRLHPFYAEQPHNLETLTHLLMTYMMYDFDIGYVQGMSDLAGPILYMYSGDLIKAFWVFVEVMKLFRRNFELTQKTIHFQLNCLYELIRITDPIFAQYLEEHDSSNCFFTFRAIVCQFKRELMRDDEDDYSNVLFLWDTIWSVKKRFTLQEELKASSEGPVMGIGHASVDGKNDNQDNLSTNQEQASSSDTPLCLPDSNQSDSPRHTLTETEIFVQALCLSMIRRERDLIMANRLDGTDIHLHFIDPKLATDLNGFIEHAINIYSYMKSELDIKKLTQPRGQTQATNTPTPPASSEPNQDSPQNYADGYDLLSDFLIINGTGS